MGRNRSLYSNPSQRVKHTPTPIPPRKKSARRSAEKELIVRSKTPPKVIRRSAVESSILNNSRFTDFSLLFVQDKKYSHFHLVTRDEKNKLIAILRNGSSVYLERASQFGPIQNTLLDPQVLHKLAFSPAQLEFLLIQIVRLKKTIKPTEGQRQRTSRLRRSSKKL